MSVSFEQYLRRSQYDPTFRGRETQDIQSALQAVSSYQTNRAVGEVLGAPAEAKPREGVLRRFMRGIDAPRRAVAAGLLDVAGYRDPRLQRRNPLQSAIAGFRGEIDLSGGDVFRLTGRESLPTKALKLGGAFAFDVATDPITYIGTPAALGRRSASELAARTSATTLKQIAESTARRSGRAVKDVEDELVERLFRQSSPGRLWNEGDTNLTQRAFGPTEGQVLDSWRRSRAQGLQSRKSLTPEQALEEAAKLTPDAKQLAKARERMVGQTIDSMTDARARQLGLIGSGTKFRTIDQWKDEAARAIGMVDEKGNRIAAGLWKRGLAEQELGRILGESLYSRGRVGLRGSLSDVAGDTQVAEEVFRQLPDRVRGGLYAVNPLTGKTITRLTEGTGESLGAFGKVANDARLQIAAFFGKGTQYISGTRGKAFQRVREDLAKFGREGTPISIEGVSAVRKETLSNYLGLKTAQRLERLATIPGIRELSDVASDLSVLRRTAANAEQFDGRVEEVFYRPRTAVEGDEASEIAQRLRNVVDNMRQRLIRSGIDVGFLGDEFTAKIPTVAGLQSLRVRRALAEGASSRAGAKVTGAGYDASVQRSTGFRVVGSDDDAAQLGFVLGDNLVALDARAANKAELAEQMMELAGDNQKARQKIADWFNDLPEDWKVPDEFNEELIEVLSSAGLRSADYDGIVTRTFIEDPLEIVRNYVEDQTQRVASATLVQQGLRLGILTRTSSDMIDEMAQRNVGEFVEGLGAYNLRIQNRLKILAGENTTLGRKLSAAIDPKTGDISLPELDALGVLSRDGMNGIINSGTFNALIPNSVEQVAALRQAVSVWAKLNYSRQAGEMLSAAQRTTLQRAQGVIKQTSRAMEEADFAIQQIDNMFADVIGIKNLTPEEMRFLTQAIDGEYKKLAAMHRTSLDAAQLPAREGIEREAAARVLLPETVADSAPPYWFPEGQAPGTRPTLEVIEETFNERMDLEVFLARSDELTGKSSNEQIEAVIKQFFKGKDVQSPVDRAAELLGLGRIGADPIAEGAISVGRELADLRATTGVREIFEARQRVAENPSAMKEFFEKVYDPLFLVWKNGATVGRGPGYTFLNMVGNLYMNLLGDVGVADHKMAARVVQAVTDSYNEAAAELVQKTGLDLTRPQARAVVGRRADEMLAEKLAGETVGDRSLFDLYTEFVNAGGVESSQVGEALATIGKLGVDVTPETIAASMRRVRIPGQETVTTRRIESVVNAFMNNRYQQTMNTVNTNVETWTRFAAFIDGYRSSGNLDVGLERMYLLHFDYGDLSNVERGVRRAFPFYVWTRNNVPAQVRAMFVQPGKIRRLMEAQETFKLALSADEEDSWLQEVLPDYIGEVGGFASSMTSGPFNVAFASKMPYDDVDRLIQSGGSFGLGFNMREIAQMVGPFTIALEAIFQRDFSTGGAFNPAGREATGWRRGLAEIPGVGTVGRYGEARIPTGLDKFLTELIPQVGTAERALTGLATAVRGGGSAVGLDTGGLASIIEAPASSAMRDRGMSNLLNVTGISPLTGMSATTLSPRTISSTLRERRNEQVAILGEAAGRQGVSLDFIREMLRKGYTPEQIAMMIQAGQGGIEQYEERQALRSGGANQRSRFLLDQLREGGPVTSLGYDRPTGG